MPSSRRRVACGRGGAKAMRRTPSGDPVTTTAWAAMRSPLAVVTMMVSGLEWSIAVTGVLRRREAPSSCAICRAAAPPPSLIRYPLLKPVRPWIRPPPVLARKRACKKDTRPGASLRPGAYPRLMKVAASGPSLRCTKASQEMASNSAARGCAQGRCASIWLTRSSSSAMKATASTAALGEMHRNNCAISSGPPSWSGWPAVLRHTSFCVELAVYAPEG
mmetsp:Transcript_76684/g.135429  ORF Transcript_76684/g.135429 Transcript_76684/m.135429 type:complete len:219 (+) Transcript_76684:11-667(+)